MNSRTLLRPPTSRKLVGSRPSPTSRLPAAPILLYMDSADRARLVDRLIATLNADPEVDEAWAVEVERRQSEIETGTVSLLPGSETLAKLKAEFE